MRYIFLIIVILAVGWIIFIKDEATSPDRVSRTLTDSEVLPIDGDILDTDDEGSPHIDVKTESPDDDDSLLDEPIDLENTEDIDDTEEASDDTADIPPVDSEEVIYTGDQEFVSYTNKSMGYTVSRPDKWYWQHFHKSEIGENSPVDDYLVMDRSPLIGLGTEYLGRIVVEVSKRSLSDFYDSVSAGTKTSATISGVSTTRYEGERNDSSYIEYQFVTNGKTYRIIYTNNNTTNEEEQIFEFFAKSFSLS
jgi:hypothetical protein